MNKRAYNTFLKLVAFVMLLLFCGCLIAQEKDSTYYWSQYEIGRSKCNASDFYNARVFLEKTLSEFKESDYQDYTLEARILTDIAWAYAGLGDNVTENIYIEAALKIYVENLKLDSEEYATALHDMALTQGDRKNFEYAVELLDSSNTIFKKHIPELYPAGRVSNLVALGWVYREQGKFKEAITALKKASDFVKVKKGDYYTDMGTVQHILGYTLMYNGDLEEALPHLLEGKRIRAQKLGTTHPMYYQSHQKIAECYTYLKIYEKAQLHLDTIIESILTKKERISGQEIQLDSIKSWYTLLYTYVSKGNIDLRQYRSDKDMKYINSNLKWYKKALDVMQKVLLYYPSKEGRFQTLKGYDFLFDNCVNQAILLYDYHKDPKYLEQAFQVSEISRGFTFLEALHKAQAIKKYNIPKALLEKESDLIVRMQKYELGNEKDLENSQDWISLNLELQKVQQSIKKDHPNHFNLKSNLIVPSIEEIQQQINDKTAVVEFFKGSKKIFIFVITKDSAFSRSVSIPKDYHSTLTRLIAHTSENPITSNKSLKSLKQDSRQLYEWLISPIDSMLEFKKCLIFIPHKKLNYLPFEILMKSDSSSKNADYLIHDYAISYDYSCTSLFAERDKKSDYAYSYHGIAPGIRRENLPDESINEIKQAHNILGGKYSTNKKANRNSLFAGLKKAGIVHIAAHSILDTSDISKFAIVLNDVETKRNRDSVLIEDIYLSDINAELIILSGCQTADGVLKDGEGLLSLTNAFKYSGANSLSCSLWQTENKVGNRIITDYITNLKKGLFKDEALRAAKLQFIKSADPLLKHPFYWSTFVNVGNQKPITRHKKNQSFLNITYISFLALFIGVIAILVLALRKR